MDTQRKNEVPRSNEVKERTCIHTRGFERMKPATFARGLRVERLADAGHFLHQEKPAEVNRLLVEWFSQHRGA